MSILFQKQTTESTRIVTYVVSHDSRETKYQALVRGQNIEARIGLSIILDQGLDNNKPDLHCAALSSIINQ